MKSLFCILILALLAVVPTGCGASKSKIDTAKVERSFQTAEPALKSHADKATAALKAGDFPGAMSAFKKAAEPRQLTADQKEAIQGVIIEVQTIMSQNPDKSSDAAWTTIRELVELLEGRDPSTANPLQKLRLPSTVPPQAQPQPQP